MARQRLRVEADRLDLRDAELRGATTSRVEKLQLKMRQDEEGLREITRVVGERGTSARAVQLGLFPKGGERMPIKTAEYSFIP